MTTYILCTSGDHLAFPNESVFSERLNTSKFIISLSDCYPPPPSPSSLRPVSSSSLVLVHHTAIIDVHTDACREIQTN